MSHAPGLPQPASTTYLRTWQKVAMIAGAASVPIAIMVTKDSDADERLIIPSSSLGPRRITDVSNQLLGVSWHARLIASKRRTCRPCHSFDF